MAKDANDKEPQSVEVHAVVDRIEDGDMAVLSLEDEQQSQLDLPLARLPAGTSDGDHLRLTYALDPNTKQRTLKKVTRDKRARDAAADRVRRLQERLEQRGGAQGKKDFKL